MIQVKVVSKNSIIISGVTRYPGHLHEISKAEFEDTMIKYPNSLEIIPVRKAISLKEVVVNTVTASNDDVIELTEEKPVKKAGRPPVKKVE